MMPNDDTSTVDTLAGLLTYVRSVLMKQAKDYQRDLGTYLRALLGTIAHYRETPVTYALMAQVLTEALSSLPLPFDPGWLTYTSPPDDENADQEDPFTRLQDMLRFLIADWQRMDEVGTLKNEYRYLGVPSPTGNYWYNFDLVGFLECGTAGMGFDRSEDMNEDEYITLEGGVELKGLELLDQEQEQGNLIAPDWEIVTALLQMGRSYE